MKTKRDETLEEIWEIRRKMAKEFGYDPQKAGAYYRAKQRKSGAKIYRREEHLTSEVLAFRETPPKP